MKKSFLYLLTVVAMVLCSSYLTVENVVNSNSWSIRIGKKELLASWKNHKMGETAVIDRQKFKATDTLFTHRYLCGYSGMNSVTTMTIKNQQNEVITTAINKSNHSTFTAKMPISEILTANKFRGGEIVSVFFSIESKSEEINQTVLLGKLKLK